MLTSDLYYNCANIFIYFKMYALVFFQFGGVIYHTNIHLNNQINHFKRLINSHFKFYNFNWVLITSLLTFYLLIGNSMASPLRKTKSPPGSLINSSPKWINPCGLPTHPIDPEKDFAGAPSISIDELFHRVMSSAKVAKKHAEEIKRVFLNNTLNDPDFEEGVKAYRQEWLPEIPSTSEEVFKQITPEHAFKTAYEFVQYFAVGLEQILLDQILHDGKMITQFKDIEYELFQLLCEIQFGMHVQNIQFKSDVLRHVMSHQYRDINESSLRNLRDYLILRDYIAATNFITELFAYHKSKITN